jgi:hypothetical protein
MTNVFKAAVSPPRRITKRDALAINRAGQQTMLQELQELEDRAMRLGMFVTQKAINQAKNALGWEMAGDLLAAGRARRGQHARRG